jgi:hypothetical protein
VQRCAEDLLVGQLVGALVAVLTGLLGHVLGRLLAHRRMVTTGASVMPGSLP